jgi:predicted nucleic acid-binding protein
MKAEASIDWAAQNQAHLLREFARLRRRLGDTPASGAEDSRDAARMEPPSAIDELTRIFALSMFERELLLLCAGVEMDSALAERCAQLTGRAQRGFVTFGLAMSVLSEPHWSALAPSSPLRRFRLIEMQSGHGVTAAALHIDERILHYLAGVNRMDQRLEGMVDAKIGRDWLTEDHWLLASDIIESLGEELPAATAVHFFGDDPSGQESVASFISRRFGRALYVLRMEDVPSGSTELDQFMALWTREALLLPACLLLQWEGDAMTSAARQLAKRLPGPLLIASREPLQLNRVMAHHEVNKAAPMGQRQLWEVALGPVAGELNGIVDDVAQQFRLSAETVITLGATVMPLENGSSEQISERLWAVCRSVSRPHLEALAERIVPTASWSDLILPPLQMQALRQLAAQSRNRMTVYERWGFALRGRRGLGISALFSGPSGTGKTLAAEVLAADLQLDLYRIDLSAVVSKYIGETEKNLRQVFDAAETGGVLLLFDEADAIFGKRAEVKDSHDRYANIEVSYLLQRMESFQGLAILTTNAKSSVDKAFQRRLRFAVDFPFPAATEREAIWTRVFPSQAPTEGLEPALLANLNMAGGNIRNIALNAAFLAAEQKSSVQMSHVLQATQVEAAKIERPLSEIETRRWV